MAEFTNGQKGVELVNDGKWDEGIELLSKAIKVVRSPPWLLARSQAYQQKGELDKALADCEHAYLAALQRQASNRAQQLTEAQYRRAVVMLKQKRYADADACAVWAMRLALGHPPREEDPVSSNVDENGLYKATVAEARAQMPVEDSAGDLSAATKDRGWVKPFAFRSIALAAMEKLPEDDPARKLTVTRVPNPPDLVHGDNAPAKKNPTPAAPSAPSTMAAPSAPKEQKLRFDYFQTPNTATLSVFIKGIDKNSFRVEPVSAQTVILRNLPRESNPDAVLSLDNEIVPAETKHKVFGTKVELTLTKARPGQKWGSWGSEMTTSDAAWVAASTPSKVERTESRPLADEEKGTSDPSGSPAAAAASSSGPPSYPTSSKHGSKDWEKLSREEAAEEETEEKEHGGVDQFFKTLFKTASPETQRAMMKSYVESGGTALSTDWNDAKNRTFEVTPPDGVEAKKWEQ